MCSVLMCNTLAGLYEFGKTTPSTKSRSYVYLVATEKADKMHTFINNSVAVDRHRMAEARTSANFHSHCEFAFTHGAIIQYY